MPRWSEKPIVLLVLGLASAGACSREPADPTRQPAGGFEEDAEHGEVAIRYPPDEALFPPEIASPTFRWEDSHADADAWRITFHFQDVGGKTVGGPRASSAASEPGRLRTSSGR